MTGWFLLFRNITVAFAAIMLAKYWLFLLVAPWYGVKHQWRERRTRKRTPDIHYLYRPLVSIIVPAWNEEVGILRTVNSLLENTYKNIEIVVVNDGSTDKSHEIVQQFLNARTKNGLPVSMIKYSYKENGGKGHALNHGIERSTGDIVVTMDADSLFDKHALANLVEHFKDQRVDAVVGNVQVVSNNTIIGLVQKLEYQFGFYFKRAHCVLGAEYIYGGACSAFRRSKTFAKFGLYDTENKTEDIEISLRTRYFGLRSAYANDVICYTEGASSIQGLVNQRLRWKKGRIDAFAKYRQLFFSLDRRHNKWLCFFILPYSVLSEFQLIFEPIGITLLVGYSIISGDYVSLGLGLLFIFASYFVIAVFNQKRINLKLLLLFPFTWPLFYMLVWVEYIVLLKSIKMITRGTQIEWQNWERKGIGAAAIDAVAFDAVEPEKQPEAAA